MLQLYHAKAETKQFGIVFSISSSVATLPCQSGNRAGILQSCTHHSLQLYHAKAETMSLTWRLSMRRLSCNFTMPKRKHGCKDNGEPWIERLQLYHAKAETRVFRECAVFRIRVATLPCQSGNPPYCLSDCRCRSSCNFTMPKRKQ